MTRRVDQLVAKRLLRRGPHDADGRAVLVALTDAGVKRLAALTPAHARAVQEMFVSRLSAHDLSALSRALKKVTVRATFG